MTATPLVKEGRKVPRGQKPIDPTERHRVAMLWHYLVEASFLPGGETACDATAMGGMWPHQRRVVEETATAWPDGRLLCDEVGMGKTIEAILVLRRLLAGRGVRRALILLPAGLLRQWQAELREKGGLIVPRLQGSSALVWPDNQVQDVDGMAAALRQPLLIASREMARLPSNLGLLLAAEPWDLVLLDESHAARRADQKEGAFNQGNLILNLLRQLQLSQQARSIMLLSATPMQTQPWEPWDLMGVLGEGGPWLAEFKAVRKYYDAINSLRTGMWATHTAQAAADVLLDDGRVTHFPDGQPIPQDREELARKLHFAPHGLRPALASWLRKASPIARRIHRNTRDTLREYHRLGILPQAPPHRRVEDLTYSYQTPGEREIYEELGRHIDRRFQELEGERPGKGFVMTIYERRMASSPYAIKQSLKRRKEGLERVMKRFAVSAESAEELPEGLTDDDMGDDDDGEPISAAYPTDPVQAAKERADVKGLLAQLDGLYGKDTKRDRFFSVLQSIIQDGRSALVFTEYSDTMEYLRDFLVDKYQGTLATYSGDGGKVFENDEWHGVTKDAITRRLKAGKLRILICTDAASEGLNLQAAGAVINYDLPWNPGKVEQRIGRVDRIGQVLTEIRVINWFLENSVDQRVYQVLRQRCGMFENFMGRMQPVLARAQKMLLGREPADTALLADLARNQDADIFARETFDGDTELPTAAPVAIASREDLRRTVARLQGVLPGVCITVDPDILGVCGLSGGDFRIGFSQESLESNSDALPPTLTQRAFRDVLAELRNEDEYLPLVIESGVSGAFRASRAVWLDSVGGRMEVQSFQHLESLVSHWDGTLPMAELWTETSKSLRQQSMLSAQSSATSAENTRCNLIAAQHAAARRRLMLELARWLACLDEGTGDLNGIFYRQMTRDIVSQERLTRCFRLLGNAYPEWPESIVWDATIFASELPPNRKQARLIGSELEAALSDPRWGITPAT
jgi:superfamily II DNA or RNA helicase